MERFFADLRFGIKLLWKEKTFSATVLLTLAVCIGANSTIFSVVNSILLKPPKLWKNASTSLWSSVVLPCCS